MVTPPPRPTPSRVKVQTVVLTIPHPDDHPVSFWRELAEDMLTATLNATGRQRHGRPRVSIVHGKTSRVVASVETRPRRFR